MLQRPHFLPKDKPKLGGTDGALREDHLFLVKSLRALVQSSCVVLLAAFFASILLPLASALGRNVSLRPKQLASR